MATSSRTDVKKKGYLYKLPVSGGVIKVWAKRWAVLRSTSPEGVVRLEYYDKEENETKGENKRVIILRNCTGCCETTEYKRSRPHAFQFSSNIGHHVFSTESQTELNDWVDSINEAVQDDRRRQRKKNKSKMAEEAQSLSSHSSRAEGSTANSSTTSGTIPHPTTLMGIYQVTIEDNDYSALLCLRGMYSLSVTPRGLKLVSRETDSTVALWHYKRIRSYAKSANRQVILTIGGSRTSGPGGKLILVTGAAKEMFSMIHRNIKLLRAAQEAEKEVKVKREVEEISATMKKKESELQTKRTSLLRPRSKIYELQQSETENKRISYPSFAEQDSDLIKLEGFAEEPDDDDELQRFLDTLDPVMQSPALDSVDTLSSDVYGSHTFSPPNIKSTVAGDSSHSNPFTTPHPLTATAHNTSNPFANTDPFSAPTQSSFYNSKEDIFENFDSGATPHKTSTPVTIDHSSNNPFLAVPQRPGTNPFTATATDEHPTNEVQQLSLSEDPNYIYAKPRKPRKKMSQEDFEKVWDDITSDFKLP